MAFSTLVAWALLSASVAGAAGGPGFAGSSGDAGSPGPSDVVAQPAGALPGIDVSHHQDDINWAKVAASGKRFAIAKATEGRTFVDPLYSINKLNAQANGIVFGAYHFAQPDGGANDPIVEADHFVDTAQLIPGNLIPVLDIERTNGLTQAEITEWILRWLDRVTERLGVRPMVYTSPAGWESRTGDTTAVAQAGYSVLWIAHWGVAEPRLPADEWGGNGWTFWQHTNCGDVPGIEGCVDLDWYESGDFAPVTIPSPDVAPPVATITAPGEVDDPVTVSFNEVVRGVTPGNVVVLSTDTATTVETSSTCRSGKGVVVECGTGNVRTVELLPLVPLVPGEAYEALVNPAGSEPVADRSGNPAPAAALAFAPPTEVEQSDAAVVVEWRTASGSRAFGRSYAVERAAGARVSFAFTGRSVTWYTATGPAMGKAAVSIDGVSRGMFDQYGTRLRFRESRTFSGLPRGAHTITVRVLGTGSSAATDTQVVVDAFEFGGDVVANPALEATWGNADASQASGGSLSASDLKGAAATFTFRGTGVDWITVRDRRQGRAEIYVDGVLVRTVDNYASTPAFGVVRAVTGLADGVHTLRIVVLGEGRPAARGTLVSVDRLVVTG
ncbi:MAG: GH25 family lysozyme [Actinomycetota bacterium]